MSASAIVDAFITQLGAASAFGAANVSTDFAVLESTAACAVVVDFASVEGSPELFGSPTTKGFDWTFRFLVYSKETGDPHATRKRVLSVIDTFIAAIKDDDTIQGQAEWVSSIRGTKATADADRIDANSNVWIETTMEVDLKEWPDG